MSRTRDLLSRREILRTAALASATLAAEACGSDGPTMTGPSPDAMPLNALLSAEYNAIKAYDAGAAILMTPPMGDPLATQALILREIALRWQAQHRAHATQLVAAVQAAGGTPIAESSVTFTPPMGFTASVANVMKLAANAEKGAAIAYNRTVRQLASANYRFLASNIEGDETQHFIVLYVLLKQLAAPGSMIISGINDVVPVPFVSTINAMSAAGLQTVADLTYM